MTDITYDWMPFETQTATELPPSRMAKTNKPYRREEEFHSALERYIADYQKHRAMIANRCRHQIP